MELAAVQGSGVRQENSRAIVTRNRYKKELADVLSILSNKLWMHGEQQGNRLQKAAKVFHPPACQLLNPNSKFHCCKGNPMLETPEF